MRDVFSILKCGWGAFFAVAGVASIVLDVFAPKAITIDGMPVRLFSGSFILGWLVIAVVFVVPAAAARLLGFAPIGKGVSQGIRI